MKLMLAMIDPTARPALTIAGIFFLMVNLLGGVYIIRHWQQLFGRDTRVDGDRPATRYLQVVVIAIPLLILTGRLLFVLVDMWRG
jgi:prolipoprotein diacylglyceryltransferase